MVFWSSPSKLETDFSYITSAGYTIYHFKSMEYINIRGVSSIKPAVKILEDASASKVSALFSPA